jgi:tRNA nucleotidyltransferase (CCA-adding enzyme)
MLRAIVSRLRFKSDIKRMLMATSRLNRTLPGLVNAKTSDFVHELDPVSRLAIYGVFLSNPNETLQNRILTYIRRWSKVEPHTTGDDLRKMGLPPSPAYGQILKALRDAWLDNELDSVEEEQTLLKQLISDHV